MPLNKNPSTLYHGKSLNMNDSAGGSSRGASRGWRYDPRFFNSFSLFSPPTPALCSKDQQSPRLGSPNPLNRSGHGSHLLKCSSLCHFHHGFLYRVSSHSLLSPYFSSANSLKHVIHWPIWFTSSLGVYVSCHFHNILRDERSHLCVCCCCFGLRVMIC